MPATRRLMRLRRLDPVILLLGLLAASWPAAGTIGFASAMSETAADFAAAARVVDRSVVGVVGQTGGSDRDRGAGFVWRPGGLVVTAAHVVAGETVIAVRLADGRELPARLMGADDVADVAVLRIEADPPIAEVAPGDGLRRGDPVAAIGDPLGFAATLTVGHVSSPARPLDEASPFEVIQHDAALNPGSSGGPLIDRHGRVVGMNVAIADGARRHVGIGFALPIEAVERVADRLARDGAIERPRLGARFRAARSLRPAMPGLGDGLVVEAVAAGSPAEAAGLEAGDVAIAAEGHPLAVPRDLARVLEAKRPGEALTLEVATGGARRAVVVPLTAMPKRTSATRAVVARAPFALGLVLAAGSRRITEVAPEGPAGGLGLAPGDEILAVGETRLSDTAAAAAIAAAEARAGAGGVALLVRRGETTRWLVVGPRGRLDGEAPFGSNAEARTSHPF